MLDEKQKKPVQDKLVRIALDAYFGGRGLYSDMEIKYMKAAVAAIEATLAERPSQPTVAAETPAAAPCEYCGPVCYGGAEHNARVEDGAKKAAPVQDEMVEYVICHDCGEAQIFRLRGKVITVFHDCMQGKHMKERTAEIEAAARVGYWKQEDVEKALVDEVYFWGERQIKAEPHAFFRCVCARFTPTPEPVDRVEVLFIPKQMDAMPSHWNVYLDNSLAHSCVFRAEKEANIYAAGLRAELAAERKEQ